MRKITHILEQVDTLLRPASVAQVGGFRPPDNHITSRFGGGFVGLPGEEWPQYKGREMLPLLQVRTDELSLVPVELKDLSLFTVFVDCQLPSSPALNGQGWLIRAYDSLEYLVPLQPLSTGNPLRPFPIRWTLEERDAPAWEDIWNVVETVDSEEAEVVLELLQMRYRTLHRTKIGGWPSYIQGEIRDEGKFLFQIDSEPKANWMWGDNGTGYFYLDAFQQWRLHWQCY